MERSKSILLTLELEGRFFSSNLQSKVSKVVMKNSLRKSQLTRADQREMRGFNKLADAWLGITEIIKGLLNNQMNRQVMRDKSQKNQARQQGTSLMSHFNFKVQK